MRVSLSDTKALPLQVRVPSMQESFSLMVLDLRSLHISSLFLSLYTQRSTVSFPLSPFGSLPYSSLLCNPAYRIFPCFLAVLLSSSKPSRLSAFLVRVRALSSFARSSRVLLNLFPVILLPCQFVSLARLNGRITIVTKITKIMFSFS